MGLTHADLDDILDDLCKVSDRRQIEAEADFIVTYSVRVFAGAELFGLRVVTRQTLLHSIGELR